MKELENVTKLFKKYAEIYSPSGKESKIREVVKSDLMNLGIEVIQDKYGNLFYPHPNPLPEGEDTILLTAHIDTVEPSKGIKVVEEHGFLISSGETIVGGDNKAGLAAIISGLAKAKSEGKSLKGIELLFTVEEESGLQGVQNVDFSVFKSKRAISFDKSGASFGEEIVKKCIFGYNLKVEVVGKSSHAGKPEYGINALQIFLDSFAGFRFGKYDNETTVNLGLIVSGDASNTVPGKLLARGDIRSFNKETIFQIEREIRDSLKTSTSYLGGEFLVEITKVLPGYEIDENSEFSVEIKNLIKSFGFDVKFTDNFGGVETAYFAENGIEPITMSCGVFDPHTVDEKVHIESLEKTTEFVSRLVK